MLALRSRRTGPGSMVGRPVAEVVVVHVEEILRSRPGCRLRLRRCRDSRGHAIMTRSHDSITFFILIWRHLSLLDCSKTIYPQRELHSYISSLYVCLIYPFFHDCFCGIHCGLCPCDASLWSRAAVWHSGAEHASLSLQNDLVKIATESWISSFGVEHSGAHALTLLTLSRPGVNIHPEWLGQRRTATITGGNGTEMKPKGVLRSSGYAWTHFFFNMYSWSHWTTIYSNDVLKKKNGFSLNWQR